QEQKQKLARKHQSTITIKEIKLRPKIDPHDYETKKGHVLRFLRSRDKVKVTIMFRGREMYHPERGRSLLLRLAEDVKDLAMIESDPLQDGRNMVMMLAPHKEAVAVKPASEAGDEEGGAPSGGGERSEAASSETAPAPETPEDETPEAASPEPESDPEPEVEAEAQAETPATPA
ncbi:MAG: translation initiation factor, partial [Gaiellales bacterium]|nr:translation initiation factor [Gaiellales bacterium]